MAVQVDGDADRARAALLALADLTPKAGSTTESLTVPLDWFTWLPDGLDLLDTSVRVSFVYPPSSPASPAGQRPMPLPVMPLGQPDPPAWVEPPPAAPNHVAALPPKQVAVPMAATRIPRNLGERLMAVQQVRSGSPMRIGFLWVAGTTELPDATGLLRRRKVLHPLLSRSVRISLDGTNVLTRTATVRASGDLERSPLIGPDVARTLPEAPEWGWGMLGRLDQIDPALFARLTGIQRFAKELAAAAGLSAHEFVLEPTEPERLIRHDGLRIVVGVALYATEKTETITRGNTLRTWATQRIDRQTAFHTVYATTPEPVAETVRLIPLETTLPLNAAQRAAVQRARTAPLTVVTGAPGTGKSHTIAAAVSDALRRGETVLVTAKTDAAVDALIDLFERQPGPAPVVFGSNERRERLAERLAAGQLDPTRPQQLVDAATLLAAAIAERDHLRDALLATLEVELGRLDRSAETARLRAEFPGLFNGRSRQDPGETAASLDAIERDLHRWWWPRRRASGRLRRLTSELGANAQLGPDRVRRALAFCEAMGSDAAVDVTAADYAQLEAAEARVRATLGSWLALDSRSRTRLDRAGIAAIGALATALRSGREARRVQLERIAGDHLIEALPLWIGTLGDVDDLLPPTAALFDLVVIDEASSTEQVLAAPALLRAGRAIVAGDPRQLRHVSFVADGVTERVLDAHGLLGTTTGAQLDVRRNSAFDAAAAAAVVSLLDEHHRCDPHLIDVVAERLYPGELTVATRSPLTESSDCVRVERTVSSRGHDNVLGAEVDLVLTELRRLHASGAPSVGVVSPFRTQADAIEARVLASLPTSAILDLDLRIGTAHGMQGNERDVIICSLGIGEADRAARRFAEDSHLLAVLLTRARRRLVLQLSYEPEPGSVLAEYVARSDAPPGRPSPAGPLDPWVAEVIGELRRAGVDVAEAYPVGRHVLDGALRLGDSAIALIAGVHPDGTVAHVDRHLALLRRNWRLICVPESVWRDRPGEAVVELLAALRPG